MSPEISLLQPRPLNGVIQFFLQDISPTLRGLSLLGSPQTDLNPNFEYDIIRGNRDLSGPNAPNNEAKKLDHIVYQKLTGSYIYLRDKKTFNATTLRWLREPGNTEVIRRNAERAVMNELVDMENRQKRYMEWVVWQMFSGEFTYTAEGGATSTINYGVRSAHKPTGIDWGNASSDPIGNVAAWRRMIERDSGASPTMAYLNNVTMTKLLKHPIVNGRDNKPGLLSDQQKQRYTTEFMLPRLWGLDWVQYDGGHITKDDMGRDVYNPYPYHL